MAADSNAAPGASKLPRASVHIRVALPRDQESLGQLRRQAEAVHARLLPDYFRVSAERDLRPTVAGAGVATLVAEVPAAAHGHRQGDRPGDQVVGYVTVRVVETPRDPAMAPRRRAHVETVVVAEGHRGGGIGTALMHAAAAWAQRRDAAEVVLTVWSDNAAAEALYRRLGYQPLARVLRKRLD